MINLILNSVDLASVEQIDGRRRCLQGRAIIGLHDKPSDAFPTCASRWPQPT